MIGLQSSLAGLIAATIVGGSATAAEFGSVSEARAMLGRALVEVKADKAAAIDKFNHNARAFRDRDLFVFCFDANDGRFTAHEAMVARDVRTFRDGDGKWYGKEIYAIATQRGIAEVVYMSPIPGSTEQAARRAYFSRVDDQVCGVSAFDDPARRASRR